MSRFQNSSVFDAIKLVVGRNGWLDNHQDIEPFVTEPRGLWKGECDMIVSPSSTEEVKSVVRICADAELAITPQSGNTGLVGGSIPNGGIVLSTRRMERILDIDPRDNTMTVEAGCILADIQRAADKEQRLFPLSLAAEGSCRIGGNLSTNAGGIQTLQYGNARDLVLGLEVVLPNGTVWNGMNRLRKDNTGYDFKHLFIGSEGTLGIITSAVLKLYPKPKRQETALISTSSISKIQTLLTRTQEKLGDTLSAFEYANEFSMSLVFHNIEGAVNPFDRNYPHYALIEVSSLRNDDTILGELEDLLATALEEDLIIDAVVAQSISQAKDLWYLRENISDAQKYGLASIKHDVSVPVSKTAEFIENASELVKKKLPGIRPAVFGHLGDGNIHFNLTQPKNMQPEKFLGMWDYFNRLVHDYVFTLKGSYSAEHGIGQIKRQEVARYNDPVGVEMMQLIKRTLDPKNIMNPGKVVPNS